MPNKITNIRKPKNGTKISIPTGTPKELQPYFKKIVKELEQLQLANSSDSSIVLSLATMMWRRDKLTKQLLVEGETFKTVDGYIKANPAAKLLTDSIAMIQRLSNNLGLDPKSRIQILGETNSDEEPGDITKMLERLAK